MKSLVASLAVVGMLGFAASASASTLTWNLSGLAFTGPGCPSACKYNTASGYFIVDATTFALVNFDINVIGTDTTANHEYISLGLGGSDGGTSNNGIPQVFFETPGFTQFLTLNLGAAMTSAGGTISLLTTSSACPGCGYLTAGSITTDSLNGAAVPEPATLALLGSGLALFVRRRRQVR